jgi:RimJ/RimL family protein N-acetyltransferase
MSNSSASDSWQGRLVRLRAIEPADGTAIVEHGRDFEALLAGGGDVPFPTSARSAQRWAEEESAKKVEGDEVHLAIETLGGELVGGVGTHHLNARHGTFSYGINVHRPFWRNGYAQEAVVLLLRHFFQERRYQKCNAVVFSFNEASIGLHHRVGFVQEGRVRRTIYAHGSYHDEIFFGITAEEFLERHGPG